MKRIVFSTEAKAGIRIIPQPIAMNIPAAIHRLAESGAGRVKMLKGRRATSASASAIFACASPKTATNSTSTPSKIARRLTGETPAVVFRSAVENDRIRLGIERATSCRAPISANVKTLDTLWPEIEKNVRESGARRIK